MLSESESIPSASPDPAAWLDRHGDILFRFAMQRLRDRDAAEDVVQECLMAGLQAKERFAGRSTERTWLIGILKRKVVDRLRKKSRETPTDKIEVLADLPGPFNEKGLWQTAPSRWGSDPGASLENEDFWRVFRECIGRMTPKLADAFMLREFDQLETEEICQVLDVTPTNLWARLHRARLALRGCLEKNWFASGSGQEHKSS